MSEHADNCSGAKWEWFSNDIELGIWCGNCGRFASKDMVVTKLNEHTQLEEENRVARNAFSFILGEGGFDTVTKLQLQVEAYRKAIILHVAGMHMNRRKDKYIMSMVEDLDALLKEGA